MEFAGTGAELIDLDSALAGCDLLIVLVDHDLFKSIPIEERGDKLVYDTRGLWLDQPNGAPGNPLHRAACRSSLDPRTASPLPAAMPTPPETTVVEHTWGP